VPNWGKPKGEDWNVSIFYNSILCSNTKESWNMFNAYEIQKPIKKKRRVLNFSIARI
jgi:hypothetical protein